MQGAVWCLPGALEPALENIYGINNDTVQLLLNYGALFYLASALPVMWALDRHGIRLVTGVGAVMLLLCNMMRLFATGSDKTSIMLLHLSYILNSIAGPIAMAVPCKLAEDFFEPAQRTTATAIGALANQTGSGFVYFLMPWLSPGLLRGDIFRMDLFVTGGSALAAVMFGIYFPSHPLVPPSRSAIAAKRGEESVTLSTLYAASHTLSRNVPYVTILIAYSLTVGLTNCTGAMLTLNIQPLGGTSTDSGFMGATANVVSLGVGVLFASVVDSLKARAPAGTIRAILVGTLAATGAAYAVFAVCVDVRIAVSLLGQGQERLWIAGGAFFIANVNLNAFLPLAFDLAGEYTFPAPEGTMLMLMTLAVNVISAFVLFMPASSFFSWANYGVVGMCLTSSALLMSALPSNLPRWEFDAGAAEKGGRGVLLEDNIDNGERDGDVETETVNLLGSRPLFTLNS